MNYASLIKKLFEARQIIHNEHLATNSFSAHKALGKFYEEILGIADELSEIYQGEFGLLDLSGPINVIRVEPTAYLKDLANFLKGAPTLIGPDFQCYHQNILDTATALCYKTIYMLTLK